MEPLNNVDIVILIGFAVSILIAFIRGFVTEVLSIMGLVLFSLLVIYLSPVLTPVLNKYIVSSLFAQIVSFLIIMAVFYTVWIICSDKLVSKIRTSTLSFMDRLFGLIFGFLRMLIILGFCFLIIKGILPEELEKGALRESKFFVLAKTSSDVIEKMLPEKFVEDTLKSFEELNKVESKEKKKEDKDEKTKHEEKSEKKSNEKMPTNLDQEQMNKMFEQLVKPELKKEETKQKDDTQTEKKGYDSKDTKNLDRLIDITTKN
jgi:membrane protein required for colicin V production